MRVHNRGIFQSSIIELFVIMLFIGLSYSYIQIRESEEALEIQQMKTEISKISSDSLVSHLYNRIDVLSDSLKIFYGQISKQQLAENQSIGTGIGPCWKKESGSISMLYITIFDDSLKVQGIWPLDYDRVTERIIGRDLTQNLRRSTNYSINDFLNSFQNVRKIGQEAYPPCYFISDLVDSTTTKQHFFRMENTVNQIFVINRKYLYR